MEEKSSRITSGLFRMEKEARAKKYRSLPTTNERKVSPSSQWKGTQLHISRTIK